MKKLVFTLLCLVIFLTITNSIAYAGDVPTGGSCNSNDDCYIYPEHEVDGCYWRTMTCQDCGYGACPSFDNLCFRNFEKDDRTGKVCYYVNWLTFKLSFSPNPVRENEDVTFIVETKPMDPWPDGYGSTHAVCISRVPCRSYDECLELGEYHLFCQSPNPSGITRKIVSPDEREAFGLNSLGYHILYAGCSRNDLAYIDPPEGDRDFDDPGETTSGTLRVISGGVTTMPGGGGGGWWRRPRMLGLIEGDIMIIIVIVALILGSIYLFLSKARLFKS